MKLMNETMKLIIKDLVITYITVQCSLFAVDGYVFTSKRLRENVNCPMKFSISQRIKKIEILTK